jgi:phosphate/phosphite/phosphonate ABC transporter binding protein
VIKEHHFFRFRKTDKNLLVSARAILSTTNVVSTKATVSASFLLSCLLPIFVLTFFGLSIFLQSPSASFAKEEHLVKDTPTETCIGILAKRGKDRVDKRWKELGIYLERTIPNHVFKIIPLEYGEVRETVRENKVDFILTNPAYYVEFEKRYGANKLACLCNTIPGRKIHREYAGVIFCRADRNDISEIGDFKGKKFMAVDRNSFGGWHMALHQFKSEGIDPEQDFSHLFFGNDNDNVVYGVLNGSVDGGTVRSDTLERMEQEGSISIKDFKVISPHIVESDRMSFLHSTKHYPEWPFASLKNTSRELARKVTIALLNMPLTNDGPLNYSWDVAQNYESVHDCLKYLQLAPYEYCKKTNYTTLLLNDWQWILAIFILTGICLGLTFFSQKLRARLNQASAVAAERVNSMAMIKSVLNIIPTGVMIVDKKSWNIEMVNIAAEKMIGLSEDEIIHKSCAAFLSTDDAREIRELDSRSENTSTGTKLSHIGEDKIMIRGSFLNSSSFREIL